MAIQLIPNYTSSDVADFHSLKGKRGFIERGIYIAESPKIVEKILGGSHEMHSAFLTPEYFERFRNLIETRDETIRVMIAEKPRMEQIVGYPLHQGVMLSVQIPEPVSMDEVIARSEACTVALDEIADAENMGAIVRNCAAFGVRTILIDSKSCSPYLRRAVRVSMGTIADIEICVVPDLAWSLDRLKNESGTAIIGAALSERAIDLADLKSPGRCVVVFGSEGWGLSEAVKNSCDHLARIPMAGYIDSLNVGIASGIFLYALRKG